VRRTEPGPVRAPGGGEGRSARIALLALALLGAAETQAGDPRLQVTVDRTEVTVGDPVTLTVRLSYAKGTTLRSFAPERSLGSLALLDRTIVPQHLLDDGRMEETRVLKVAAYQVGTVEIPALQVQAVDASGREEKASSEAITLNVASVLKPGETAPADIKPQARMPERPLWPLVLLALVAAAVAGWLVWRRRRPRAPEATVAPAGPPRPAHEIAYAELERLLSSGLLEAGRIKELYIEMAEILRRYVSARFGVETFERTSTEILEALRAARTPVKVTAMTAEFFAACDLVKFAKHRPGIEETRGAFEMAYRLVDETRPAAPAAEMVPEAPAAASGAAR
jgi:hypothetical protein